MLTIQQVIKSNEIPEKEIQTTGFRWYQMNIIPYVKMRDNKTDGVIRYQLQPRLDAINLAFDLNLYFCFSILLQFPAGPASNSRTSAMQTVSGNLIDTML